MPPVFLFWSKHSFLSSSTSSSLWWSPSSSISNGCSWSRMQEKEKKGQLALERSRARHHFSSNCGEIATLQEIHKLLLVLRDVHFNDLFQMHNELFELHCDVLWWIQSSLMFKWINPRAFRTKSMIDHWLVAHSKSFNTGLTFWLSISIISNSLLWSPDKLWLPLKGSSAFGQEARRVGKRDSVT